jgi:hypothetical protein
MATKPSLTFTFGKNTQSPRSRSVLSNSFQKEIAFPDKKAEVGIGVGGNVLVAAGVDVGRGSGVLVAVDVVVKVGGTTGN